MEHFGKYRRIIGSSTRIRKEEEDHAQIYQIQTPRTVGYHSALREINETERIVGLVWLAEKAAVRYFGDE